MAQHDHRRGSPISSPLSATIQLDDIPSFPEQYPGPSRTVSTYSLPPHEFSHGAGGARDPPTQDVELDRGADPARQRRRHMRKVRLVQGSVLSIDYPVPSAVRNSVQPRYLDEEGYNKEFFTLRYTAVTCDPNDFTIRNGYDLRPNMHNRHTELFVCVTYYNEDKVLFARTYHSVIQNVRDIIDLKRSAFWNLGGPAWQKIVLCVVMDGIESCDHAVLDTLAMLGLYQDGILKRDVDGHTTIAHLFEYTTQLSVTPNQELIRPTNNGPFQMPPVQVLLCLKSKNSGKINSNRWIYSAFGRILNPEVVLHVDTGTRLEPNAMLRLWQAFYNDKDLGGACGAIHPVLGKGLRELRNPLVAAQNFEYKVACQLERALESTTGYLSVLPGAFSAYRFRAVIGRPLEQYFYGDPTLEMMLGKKAASASLIRLNRFLADDRIMSSELVCKAGHKWHTRLVTRARGETDAPISTVDFINQRRRWLNGSLSASIYSIRMSHRLFRTDHNPLRMLLLFVQMGYNIVAFILAWFSLAGFLLTTFIVNEITGSPPPDAPVDGFPFGSATPIVNAVIQMVYLATVVFQFIIALGGRPRSHILSYTVSFSIFAVVQLYLIVNLIYLTKRLVDFRTDATGGGAGYGYISEYYADVGSVTVLVTAVAVFGVYAAAGVICLDPWHLLHSWAQYLFISTSYVNILKTYAFSNIHDASWGHKTGKKARSHPPWGALTGAVRSSSGGGSEQAAVVEEVDRPQEDIDRQFEQVVRRALAPFWEGPPRPEEETREETFMKFRTFLVAAYLFSNFLVCVIVMNDSFRQLWWLGDPYWHKVWFFRIWMWGNSALLLMQFVGCVYQRLADLVRFLFERV